MNSQLPLKCEFDEVLNFENVECRVYFDRINRSVELCDDIYNAEDLKRNASIVFFPTAEVLYPYSEALRDYLNNAGLFIPKGYSPKGYLAEIGCIYDFYDFRKTEMKNRFSAWLKSKSIPMQVE